jgi:hypothetical protein
VQDLHRHADLHHGWAETVLGNYEERLEAYKPPPRPPAPPATPPVVRPSYEERLKPFQDALNADAKERKAKALKDVTEGPKPWFEEEDDESDNT